MRRFGCENAGRFGRTRGNFRHYTRFVGESAGVRRSPVAPPVIRHWMKDASSAPAGASLALEAKAERDLA
jgi:hypothetical protein